MIFWQVMASSIQETGWILNFVRLRGEKNQLDSQDVIGLVLLFITLVLYFYYSPIHQWIISP